MPDSEKPRRPLNEGERESVKAAREMRPLVALSGWKVYTRYLQAHLDAEEAKARAIVRSVDEAIEQNAAKGAVMGLRLALSLPSSIINDADGILQSVGGDAEE